MSTIPEPDRLAEAPHPRETSVLFGQADAEARFLEAARADRMHHGWLITGPRGVGKSTLAWRIARHMLSAAAGDSLQIDASSPAFRQVAALSAPGLFLCRRPWDEKNKRLRTQITLDEVRALKDFFQLSSAQGTWRVAIVDAADELNSSAANALLKILEEPPTRSLLLLVCHQPGRLLPTIRSRCRELRCQRLQQQALGQALEAAGFAPERDTDALTELAEGSAGEAIRLIVEDGVALYGTIAALIADSPGLDRRRLGDLADASGGRDSAARYDATLSLIQLAISRLARRAAGAAVTPVSDAEGLALERLGATAAQARLWADLAARLNGRIAHARAVNLDPVQVILDTFLQIDAAAAEALPANA